MTKQIPKIKDYPLITLNVSDIKKDPTNPNNMTLEQINGLEKSIVNFGRLKYIVVDQDNILIDGEHRLEVEKANGTTKVQVIQVPVKNEIERKMMRETLNQLHGDYDKQKQSSELLAIFENQKLDELAELLGKPREEFENLITRYNPEITFIKEEDESKLPSIFDTESFVKRGEIWQLGRHKILCGDCTNKDDVYQLMQDIKADMVFTDPPYGINLFADYTQLKTTGKGLKWNKIYGDDKPYNPNHIFRDFNYCKEIFLFGADYYCEHIPDFHSGNFMVWDKTLESNGNCSATNMSEFELIWTKQPHKRSIYHVTFFRFFGLNKEDINKRMHPTQKPIELIKRVFKDYGNTNDLVVDPFLGSGSTLIACEQTNRICYGLEIDEMYSSVICKRFYNYTNIQPIRLFDGKTMSEVEHNDTQIKKQSN